jgi:cell division protein FtsQ
MAWALVFFFAVASLLTILLTLPVWRINQVEVFGATMVSERYIKERAAIPLGDNLFFLNLKKPTASLAQVWQFADCKIKKRLPATIRIEVVERVPFAVVVISNEAHVIDKEGFILKIEGNAAYDFVAILNTSNLPVVSGLSRTQLEGHKLNAEIAGAIGLSISRCAQFLAAPRLQLDLSDLSAVCILIDDVLNVKIGSFENLKEKMDVLETILQDVRGRWNQIKYIDVRCPKNPVVNFKP